MKNLNIERNAKPGDFCTAYNGITNAAYNGLTIEQWRGEYINNHDEFGDNEKPICFQRFNAGKGENHGDFSEFGDLSNRALSLLTPELVIENYNDARGLFVDVTGRDFSDVENLTHEMRNHGHKQGLYWAAKMPFMEVLANNVVDLICDYIDDRKDIYFGHLSDICSIAGAPYHSDTSQEIITINKKYVLNPDFTNVFILGAAQ